MPTVLELPSALRDVLYSSQVANFLPQVFFTGRAKIQTGTSAGGFPIFSTDYHDVVNVNLSNRVSEGGIKFTLDKPEYPIDGTENYISAGEVTLDLINTDTYIAIEQDGAILDASQIEGGRIYIQLYVGASINLDMFRGHIVDNPTEALHRTSFKIRDEFWKAVQKPLLYEVIEDSGQGIQNSYVVGESFYNYAPTYQIANGFLQPYDGYVCFSEDGDFITSMSNSSKDKVDLRDIKILNGANLGKYTIEFTTGRNFRLTYPGNSVFVGNADADFTSPFIDIDLGYWTFGATDLSGIKIEFYVRSTWIGNPVSLVKNILIKAFKQNWGASISDTTAANFVGADLPVLWNTFNDLEIQFNNFRVYFSETNKSNDVFEKKTGNKPLNCLEVCQRILDHIGASLLIDNIGRIYVQGAFIADEEMFIISGAEAIVTESFKIESQKRINYLTINYGRNDNTGNLGGKKEYDLRADPEYDLQERVFNLPYFKVGIGQYQALEMACTFKRKFVTYGQLCSFDVVPQHGVSIMPGDRFRVYSTQQPEIDWYVEVLQVSKSTTWEEVSINAKRLPPPEGELATVGSTVLCNTVIW